MEGGIEIVQRPGEALVFSANWLHCVTNEAPVLGIALQANQINERKHIEAMRQVAWHYGKALRISASGLE